VPEVFEKRKEGGRGGGPQKGEGGSEEGLIVSFSAFSSSFKCRNVKWRESGREGEREIYRQHQNYQRDLKTRGNRISSEIAALPRVDYPHFNSCLVKTLSAPRLPPPQSPLCILPRPPPPEIANEGEITRSLSRE
jgi:hypothetical protein